MAVVIGIGMIVTAVLLSNVYMGKSHVVEPSSVITVSSTYPSTDMYAGQEFTFYVNWTTSHAVKDVVVSIEIIKPDASLNDTSVSFAWVASDGTISTAALTDLGAKFVVQTEPANADVGGMVSYQILMAYNVAGDWSVNCYADGNLA
jgi:hypothetical protein